MVALTTPERRLGTYNPSTPAVVSDLTTGIQLRLALYSAREGRLATFEGSSGAKLQLHAGGGQQVELELQIAGNRFAVRIDKRDPWLVTGSVELLESIEVRLRLWVVLILEVDGSGGCVDTATVIPPPVRGHATAQGAARSADPVVLRAQADSDRFALVFDTEPDVCGAYASLDDLRTELASQGYLPGPRSQPDSIRVAAARFVTERVERVGFAMAIATDDDAALDAARNGLDAARPPSATEDRQGSDHGEGDTEPPDVVSAARAAIRDVLGWNTLYDAANHAIYTGLSRTWTADKFGGWLVWQSDVLYNALLASMLGDAELTAANLRAVLHAQQPPGNLPCLISGRQAWVDRSHPPLAAMIVAAAGTHLGDRSLGTRYLPTLLRSHRWWEDHRASTDGLLAYGSSATGAGLYRGTDLAARNESSMDNSPMFDGTSFDPARGVLDAAEVGLNALHVLDAEALIALCADVSGTDPSLVSTLTEGAEARREAIATHLWDDDRRIFAGRHDDGRFVTGLTATSFYPLVAGAATRDQATQLVEHLVEDGLFGGALAIPSNARTEAAATENHYWRGRVWPPLTFLVHLGLRRYGFHDVADELAQRAWALFEPLWSERRLALENYHPTDPSLHVDPDVDTFYSWSALLPATRLLGTADASPWDGLRIGPMPGNVVVAGRSWSVDREPEGLRVTPPGWPPIRIDGADAITQVAFDGVSLRFRVGPNPETMTVGTTLALRWAAVDGAAHPIDLVGSERRVTIERSPTGSICELVGPVPG